MNIGQNIKKRRNEIGITLLELAESIGVREATVQRYESGSIKNIKHETIINIANALKTTPAFLMGWSDNAKSDEFIKNNAVKIESVNPIPILGYVAAGMNVLAEENFIGYELTDTTLLKNNETYFYLKVHGDSMAPRYEENDLILVQKQPSVDSGTNAVVCINGNEGVVKKVVYGDNWIELHSINPNYPKRRFDGRAVEDLYVIGKVIRTIKFE